MYHLQAKLVKETNKSQLLRSSCNPSQGRRWRVCDCPVRSRLLCSFSSASFVWTFSCGWSLEGTALAITFSLFPGRDSWSSFGSQQELSILHSLSLLCPLFLSPFHNCRLSVQENYLALMFKHLCKGQNEPSAHTPLKPGIALPWALLTWALKGPSEFLHIAVLHTAFIVTYEPYVQKTFDLFPATRMW